VFCPVRLVSRSALAAPSQLVSKNLCLKVASGLAISSAVAAVADGIMGAAGVGPIVFSLVAGIIITLVISFVFAFLQNVVSDVLASFRRVHGRRLHAYSRNSGIRNDIAIT